MTDQKRTRAGVPAGGQFATTGHDESDVALEPQTAIIETPIMRGLRIEKEAKERIDDLVAQYEASHSESASHYYSILSHLVEATKTAKRQGLINAHLGSSVPASAYKEAAVEAIQKAGLGPLTDLEKIWADSLGSPRDRLGFRASGKFDDLDTSNMDAHRQDRLGSITDDELDREIHIGAYAEQGASMTASRSQFVSVSLTDDEKRRVIESLNGPSDWTDAVDSWSTGVPLCAPGTEHAEKSAGMVWDSISHHVRRECPNANAALQLATDMHGAAVLEYEYKCNYLGSDKWREDQVDAELDSRR